MALIGEHTQEENDEYLSTIKANNMVYGAVRDLDNTDHIAVRLNQSMTLPRLEAMIPKSIPYEKITRMLVATYRRLESATLSSGTQKNPAKTRFYPSNSYYTFNVLGDTLAERYENVAKVVRASVHTSLEAPAASTDATHPESQESTRKKIKPSTNTYQYRHGIKDLHFLETDALSGCLSVSNRGGNVFVPAVTYAGLLTNIEKRESISEYIKGRIMRCQIRSWISIGPLFEGSDKTIDIVKKLGKGITFHRIFNNNISLFQFADDNLSVSPFAAAVAMGALHKSLCFQIKGDTVKNYLNLLKDETVISTGGELKYRAPWKSDENRPSKCVLFTPKNKEDKLTDGDLMAVVNSNIGLHNFYYAFDRTFGVARKREKLVPSSISVGRDLSWTSITIGNFNKHSKERGMNCLSVSKTNASDLSAINSTRFSFIDIPKEQLDNIVKQQKVLCLYSVYDNNTEDEGLFCHGVIKTSTGTKGRNMCQGFPKNFQPIGKNAYDYTLLDLRKECDSHFDYEYEKSLKQVHDTLEVIKDPVTLTE